MNVKVKLNSPIFVGLTKRFYLNYCSCSGEANRQSNF